ncbi:putative potassium transport system protein kup 2 [uncultured delta proteobacterium]|uniref:Probable potassium transport system protein Kup n=1 Tax=uncultured delta proteobacterium TaxID=34034 RepID=A0A212JCJ7_9DELT|nr:putative potassium transport system protein kup 2 [uncultured delta proteobacterium]
MAAVAVTALGVVFGDIGTSPLYALRECFHGPHAIAVNHVNVMGVLSLIFWSLMVVITIKYVCFVTRADHHGEGGTFALLSIVREAIEKTPDKLLFKALPFFALGSAALLYSDGIITPAVSVLSAVEGLRVATAAADPFVVPITCVILVVLFLLQKHGTARIGNVFGPVMLLWFATLAGIGIINILKHPTVLLAVSPHHALAYFAANHIHGFVVLGTVVLCITGGEALYADLGHFSRLPIRNSWFVVVCPALVLNYLGQGALILNNPDAAHNPFYRSVPEGLLIPMLVLATAATVIASQALITGVYSLTQQAMQLGFMPRMRVVHTSSSTRGQVYLPTINTILMLACVALVLIFESSSGLAAAYGLAVTGAMGITSILYFAVTRFVWGWPLWRALPLLLLFLLFDLPFLGANLVKILDGGWLPLLASVLIVAVMTTWQKGRARLADSFVHISMPLAEFLSFLRQDVFARSPGTGVFMTMNQNLTPPPLATFSTLVHAVPETVVLLTIRTVNAPYARAGNRIMVNGDDKDIGFYRMAVSYGYMEQPDMVAVMEESKDSGVYLGDATFYLGRETFLPAEGHDEAMRPWRRALFDFLSRNAWDASIFFNIPSSKVMEIGTRLKL